MTHLGHFDRSLARFDVLVVGSGITGLTIARCCADRGRRVLVVDRRDHFAGNCYDELDERGCLVHRYGPHIFHTASKDVFGFLSRFTSWRPYEHRVLTQYGDKLMPMPVNATTLELFFDVRLKTEADAERLLASLQQPVDRPESSEDVCLGRVGRELYEALFKPYTEKQWGRSPKELDRSVCGRIPVRTNRDDRYFTDEYQRMPKDGYSAMLDRMIDHPLIKLQLQVDGRELMKAYDGPVVWTGQLDELFDCRLGRLPWRSLEFDLEHFETGGFVQSAAVINQPSLDVPFTRSTEYRWLTDQQGPLSAVHYERPSAIGEPYYPVPSPDADALAGKYREMAKLRPRLVVCGRLGRYQYLEMGQAVGSALVTFRKHERLLVP